MSDALLPVFSFRPNWLEPMLERLSFLTDVIGTDEGVEQRRAIRETPRRSYEADFLLTHQERTFWDLFIHRLGAADVTAPIYWEVVTIPATLTATVSDRVNFDTTRREWEYHEGKLAILMGKTALDYEVVEIAAVDPAGVDLVLPPARSWPKGTKLYPLRRAVLEDVGEVRQPSAAVGVATARLRLVGPNPWLPEAYAGMTYGGLPVLLDEPNWVEDLSVMQDREVALLDTGVGRTYQVDATGRILLGQSHRWFLPGKDKLANFRDLLYRNLGRQGAFWLPTFKADFKLAAPASSSATQITVENVGYGYTGGPSSGREYIAIKHSSGTIIRRILTVDPGTTPATEKLGLDQSLGLDLSPGQVRRISFADTARFDSDDFEITHFGGIEAHHDSQTMFRTFRNTRTTPSPISLPIPTAIMGTDGCGSAAIETYRLDDIFPTLSTTSPGYPGQPAYYPATLEIGPFEGRVDVIAGAGGIIVDDRFFFNGVPQGTSTTNTYAPFAPLYTLDPGETLNIQVFNTVIGFTGASGFLLVVER